MTMGHYLRSMNRLTSQWTPTNFRDERRQRLYMKDIDCPREWHDVLQKIIHPNLFYLNENVTSAGGKTSNEDDMFRDDVTAAPAGDLMANLPQEMRAQNLMCYIGHEGTYTPAHREMCASLGQNIMVEASGSENGEKPGSSIWFMTESKDRDVVREYFLSMLGHDIEIEKHFAQINAWKKAPFNVYVVDQRPGDFILIPPLAAHQVWNRGTRTMKVAWNRTTAETLEMAMHEALPKARLVCRDEQYKNKAMIFFTLQKYHNALAKIDDDTEQTQMSFIGLGQQIVRDSPRVKQLVGDFKKLFHLFTEILVDEMFASKEKEIDFVEYDSCVTCSYCRSNIFNRFLTCNNCARPLINGDTDAYDICMECYAMGRSCACMSGLKWCEQWHWSRLVNDYELWRTMIIKNDGFVDFNTSPQPLEVARQTAGKKSVAQVCQESLKRRPFKDITQPEEEIIPTDSELDGEGGKAKKKNRRKKKKGELRKCHVCCHKDYSFRVHECTNVDCSESYCYGVLYRAFDMMPQKVLQDEQWQCPKCLGICNCGYCRRHVGTENAYTPSKTSLGHDTRHIADDRSVEALVDFRLHNLSWLKAAGEEGRSRDSKRMQRLRQEADTAKAQDLAGQIQTDAHTQDNLDGDEALLVAQVEQSGDDYQRDSDEVLQRELLAHNAAEDDLQTQHESFNRGAMDGDESGLAEENDVSLYPDPSIIARQRIGRGYYEQDDTPDKILFDPFQAPTEEAIRLAHEPDVPENVKKSIRAARRKARRDLDDPEFTVGRSHKKSRLNNEPADILDSMDPALFGDPSIEDTISAPGGDGDDRLGAQVTVLSPLEQDPNLNTCQNAGERSSWKGKSAARFDANEPELRHAKPLTSYVEMDEVEMDEGDENEEAHRPGPVRIASPVPSKGDAIDVAADASPTVLKPARQLLQNEDPAPIGTGKRRGRPPKRPSEANAIAKEGDSIDENGLQETANGLSAEFNTRGRVGRGRPFGRGRRGQPRKSVGADLDIVGSSSNNSDGGSGQDDQDFRPTPTATGGRRTRGSRGRSRGRPRRSDNSDRATMLARKAPEETSFMSMAERMALRGKKFKIGSRKAKRNSTTRNVDASDEAREEQSQADVDRETPEAEQSGLQDDDDIGEDENIVSKLNINSPPEDLHSEVASQSDGNADFESPTIRAKPKGPTVVRLADLGSDEEMDDFTNEIPNLSGSDDGSDDEDIPARLNEDLNTPKRNNLVAIPVRGRGFRGRGRARGRSRGA